jgi:hypothetical protein
MMDIAPRLSSLTVRRSQNDLSINVLSGPWDVIDTQIPKNRSD